MRLRPMESIDDASLVGVFIVVEKKVFKKIIWNGNQIYALFSIKFNIIFILC